MLDEINRTILQTLQEDARTPTSEIARQVGITPTAVRARIRKLEAAGLIRGYKVRLDPAGLSLKLLAYLFVRTSEPEGGGEETAEALARVPEVQEVHHLAGDDCYVLKVRVRDTRALARLLRERIESVPRVTGTRTMVVIETIKETGRLPLPGGLGGKGLSAA